MGHKTYQAIPAQLSAVLSMIAENSQVQIFHNLLNPNLQNLAPNFLQAQERVGQIEASTSSSIFTFHKIII